MSSRTGKTVVGIILVIVFFLFGFTIWGVNQQSSDKGTEAIAQVINRALLQCYALEGAYPESLDHLAANYGVILNENLYYYHYEPYGANIAPIVQIFKK